ncbi:unnamed protein product [Amoebophrya sp. A120]|nr:unnamed protein product [Amoebophrya sp. A120]|eukprot:GSA120T00006156001.1
MLGPSTTSSSSTHLPGLLNPNATMQSHPSQHNPPVKPNRFSVKIADFKLSNLTAANEPYLRLDFDHFKCFQTDKEKIGLEAGVFEYGFKAGFLYSTRAVDKLPMKRFKIHCYDHVGSGKESILLGSTEIDLHALSTGGQHVSLTLKTGPLPSHCTPQELEKRRPVATLEFQCFMKMLSSEFTIQLSDLKLSIQGWPAAAKWDLCSTLREDLVIEAPFSNDGQWDQISLQFDTTWWDMLAPLALQQAPNAAQNASGMLAAPQQLEGLKIVVYDETSNVQGTVMLPFRDYFFPPGPQGPGSTTSFAVVSGTNNTTGSINLSAASADGQQQQQVPPPFSFDFHKEHEFQAHVTYGDEGDQVGEFTGKLLFRNLPRYAQMVGGTTTDDGLVEGGCLLCKNLPPPRCYNDRDAPPFFDPYGYNAAALASANHTAGGAAAAGSSYLQTAASVGPSGAKENVAGGGAGGIALLGGNMEPPDVEMEDAHQNPLLVGGSGSGNLLASGQQKSASSSHQPNRFSPPDNLFSNVELDMEIETPDDIELPPNWEQRRASNGRPYFADHVSKKTTWKDPRFMPDNWDQRLDPITGKVYFAYHKTRQTTFVDPRGMPPGWEMRLSSQGTEYFAHYGSKKTCWTDPRGLEDGVDMHLDFKSRVYYVDHRDTSTTWDDPRERMPNPMALRKWEFRQWWRHQIIVARAAHEEALRTHAEREDREQELLGTQQENNVSGGSEMDFQPGLKTSK